MQKYKYMKPEETGRLYCVIDNDNGQHSIRNRAIFYLAKYCALRISEIGMLKTAAYDATQNRIYCERLKHGEDNTLWIVDLRVIQSMQEYLKIRDRYPLSEYLFVSQKGNPISRKTLDKIMRKYGRRAGLPESKQHFHVLRHTRAVELGECGLDTKEIQWWLGHKSIGSTMIYLRFTTRQQQNLYDKLLAQQEAQ